MKQCGRERAGMAAVHTVHSPTRSRVGPGQGDEQDSLSPAHNKQEVIQGLEPLHKAELCIYPPKAFINRKGNLLYEPASH